MKTIAAVIAVLILAACSENVSPRAERVFYRSDGMAAWGTVCKLNKRGFLGFGERGYVSAAHVTENGMPLVGPKDALTVSDALSDWSFLGIDPAKLDADDYPAMKAGEAVTIHGFPARDRDGEVIPGTIYTDDPVPPFWWVELHDSDDGIAAEGVIGGISGSCVFDGGGALVAVVHANGFSRIEGTTNTWAKVIPVREAILQAQRPRGAVLSVSADPLPAPAPAPVVTVVAAPPPPAAPVVQTYVAPPPAPPLYIDVSGVSSAIGPVETQPFVYENVVQAPPAQQAPVRQTIAPSTHRTIMPAPRAGYRSAPPPAPAGGFRCTVCF